MKLYNYFRSSASFRVRIALNLKGLAYEYLPVHLAKGDHRKDAYTAIPAHQLLPKDALGRTRVRALAQSIACEIHPLNNLRVLKYLSKDLGVSEDVKNTWYRHWVRDGLESFERQLAAIEAQRQAVGLPASVYCYGDAPTLADCCLVPQIFNAQRFSVELGDKPAGAAPDESACGMDRSAVAGAGHRARGVHHPRRRGLGGAV